MLDLKKLAFAVELRRGRRTLRDVEEEAGVSASTLSRIERGIQPDLDTYARICDWLDKPMDYFRQPTPQTA